MKFFRDVVDASTWLAAMPCCVKKFALVGSSLYVSDPKDVDIAVLLTDKMTVSAWCEDRENKTPLGTHNPMGDNWRNCCEQYERQKDDDWQALRKGNVNLLVTADESWFDDMVTASEVCAALNLERKSDRVRVHRVIRDRLPWEQAKSAPMREGVVD